MMDPGAPFSTFQDEAFAALMDATKASSRLANEDVSFHRSFDSGFASAVDQCNTTILSMINSLLRNTTAGTDLDTPRLGDSDDIETHWKDIVEVVDFSLEKADTCLDEYTGAIKEKNPEPLPGARQVDNKRRQQKSGSPNMFKNRNLPKPQLTFRTKPNNYDATPFKPILLSKPNALVPLKDSIRSFIDDKLQTQYYHPYKTEIEKLEYPKDLYSSKPPIDYLSFESTQAIYVDTEQSLAEMLKDLKTAKEIAIDLEHHDYRSFVGFVCLMQISTREKDWIIDTLKLREELQVLNEVFTDPKIVKVLHGAYMDIIWLQRDFGLYVVGLFDTYEAARSLGFASKGLAFLLKKYVDFDADKQYQLADWRIRPLPQEMLDYARSDTHFLLYCFDKVRNELIGRSTVDIDLFGETLSNSKETSLRLFERESYDTVTGSGQYGWATMLKRTPAVFSPEQLEVFKAMHHFRDKVARDEDESTHYIMPRHQIYNLARSMPEDVSGILAACHPVSPPVRLRMHDIISIIRTAREKAVPTPPQEAVVGTFKKEQDHDLTKPVVHTSFKTREAVSIFEFGEQSSIRTTKSRFWGETFGSSKWVDQADQGVELGKALADVRLAVPLPQLTAAIFINPNDSTPVTTRPHDPGSRAEHEFVRLRPKQEDEIIVVKQVGGGKKRRRDKRTDKSTPSLEVEDVDEAAPEVEDADESKKKKVKKATEESTSTPEPAPFKAFDYTKAPSVLNKKEERSSQAFDPYKPGGGPKGGKRGRREKEGKSVML